MPSLRHVLAAVLLALLPTSAAVAKLADVSREVLLEKRAEAGVAFAAGDSATLLRLLETEHLFVKREVALLLGRLGVEAALPLLREYNEDYANFACARSGEFAVAIVLIQNPRPAAQKAELLKMACLPRRMRGTPLSVIDAAARELARYSDPTRQISRALAKVGTYGAQFTVLKLRCDELPSSEAITLCADTLGRHETPQNAQAAEELLVAFGPAARPAMEALKARVSSEIRPDDPAANLRHTILRRCDYVLRGIENTQAEIRLGASPSAP